MKNYVVISYVLIAVMISHYGFSQSPSADCATTPSEEIPVMGSCTFTGWDIGQALGSPSPSTCTGETPSGEDGWGWFTATETQMNIEYDNTTQDAVVYVFSGTCGSLTEIGCASDVTGTGVESLVVNTTPGQQYFVRVVRLSGVNGQMQGQICVWAPVLHCTNSIQDADETGIDCGGADCQACMVCDNNMDCGTAQTVTLTGGPDTVSSCFNDCNTGADPESWNFTGSGCPDITNAPTVYYTFTTTFSFIDIILTSSDIADPQMVLMANDCSGWYECNAGTGGSSSIMQYRVLSGTTYSVMISSQSGSTGVFNLCVYNYNDPSACNVSDTLIATPPADTTGGNVTGIYYPGQTVEFCYTVNQYNKVNCQWLMGIVPIIGPGWDTTTFTITQMPASADGDGNWFWFYATDNVVYYNTTGDTVNPFGGWFYLNDCMGCPPHLGDPDNGWGDGMCGGPCQCDPAGSGFTWTVCFQLTAKSTCTLGEDLTVGIKTYSDGEIGGYTEVACQVDMEAYPAIAAPTMACTNCQTVSTSAANVTCSGGASGSATVTIDSLGTPPFTYLWSNSGTQSAVSGLTAGTYYVTVTDAGGCTDVDTSVITEPPALVAGLMATNASCFGSATGSVDLTPSGGMPAYTYAWSTGAVTEDISSVTANTYTVTLSDANGCSITNSATVTEPADLSGTISGTNISCNGGNDGAADLTPGGGTLPYTYIWSTSSVTQDISGLTAGSYTVTITDGNSCVDSASVTLTQPTALSVSTAKTDILCNDDSTGTATASGSGGTVPYSYIWNTGAWTQNLVSLQAGTYSVTLTDSNLCTSTAFVTITEPPALLLAITDTIDASCGASDGSATVTPAGGVSPYYYLWDDPLAQTDSTVTGLSSGTFNVTVTDANSCTGTTSVNISNLGAPSVSITDTINNLCYGDSAGSAAVTPSGGTLPYTYLWDDPQSQTDSTATGLPAGTFTVTITDNSGCNAITSVDITSPPVLNVAIASITDVGCFGDSAGSISISVVGGTPVYSYLWNTGATGDTLQSVSTGSYTVTVTDANGCTDWASEIVTEPPLLSFSITGFNDVTCNGDSNGSVFTATAGGVLPYSYLWNTGFTGDTLQGVSTGSYSVTVTDVNGCSLDDAVTLTEPALLTLSTSKTDILCNGDSTGMATATAAGGTVPYTYLWNDSTGTNSRSSLQAGTYSVTVTDANECTVMASISITEPPALSLLMNITAVSCNGYNDGAVDLTVTGGITPYSFLWNTGLGTQDIVSLQAGTYSVTVTDSNLCTKTDSAFVTEPNILTSLITATPVACANDSDGIADLVVTGGTPPYTYVWSDGSSNQDLNFVPANDYYVTVTDANGCSITDSVAITQPAAITSSVTGTNASCNGCSDGSADLTSSGGILPYSFNWSNGDTDEDADSLAAGTYYVTITDFNGCTKTDSVIITEPACAMTLLISAVNVACNGDSTGSATAIPAGGSLPYTFAWSNGGNQSAVGNLQSAIYTVTVTANNGCTVTDSVTITEPSIIILSTGSSNADCAANNGYAWVAAAGGIQPYSFLWDVSAGSQTTDTAFNLAAGLYDVSVTDSNGCVVTATATVISGPGNLLAVVDSSKNISCAIGVDGAVYISVLSGTPPYFYAWSNGSTDEDINGLDTGIYSVIITDNNSCVFTLSSALTSPAMMLATTGKSDAACGQNNGYAWITVIGGTLPYTYLWNPAAGSQVTDTAWSLLAGTYSVTVTDANGCTLSVSGITLNNIPGPSITADSLINVSCAGSSDGYISVIPSGGTPPYTYLWNTGAGTQDLVSLQAGTYSVTVTDSNGCLAVGAYVITEPAPLVLSLDSIDNSLCSATNGSVYLSASGGITPYQFSTDGINYQAGNTFTGLSAGNYLAYVRDANSCTASDSFAVAEIGSPFISVFSVSHVSCFGGSNGSVSILAGGGIGPYNYSTDNGVTWSPLSTLTGLTAGTYPLVVKDSATGCISVASSAVITQPTSFAVSMLTSDETCDYADDGQITARVTGGTAPYFFTWSHSSDSDSVASVLTADAYYVTVTDYRSCVIIDTGIINTIGINCLTIPTSFSPNDDGVNDTWIIKGLNGFPDATVEVFNRWGSKIFSYEKGYAKPWDGTYDGSQVSSATYYFIITFGTGDEPVTGTVTVVR